MYMQVLWVTKTLTLLNFHVIIHFFTFILQLILIMTTTKYCMSIYIDFSKNNTDS